MVRISPSSSMTTPEPSRAPPSDCTVCPSGAMVVLICTTAETISSRVAAPAETAAKKSAAASAMTPDIKVPPPDRMGRPQNRGRSYSRTKRNATRFLLGSRPGAFVLLLVILECFDEAAQHLRRCLEHRLELGLVDLVDVGAQMIDRLLQARRHLVHVME